MSCARRRGLFLLPIFLIGAVALGIAAYFIIPGTDLEYEYLFVNGELDIDKIMAKSKRKKAKTVDLTEADLIAPLDSTAWITIMETAR